MNHTLLKSKRLDVVDALRGFALLAIVLIHNVEHYNIFCLPEGQPEWLSALDRYVWDGSFFLLAGKAFSTFSLLFGFSFFIQLDNQQKRGYDFRARFAWRLILLMLFAELHSLFYNGDILLLYAFCGFALLAVCRLSDKVVFWTATFLLLQPFEWYRMIHALADPAYETSVGSIFLLFYEKCQTVVREGNFWEFVQSNITNGQVYSNCWQVENGRLFQVPALFMYGMLLGRLRFFEKSERSLRFWKRLLRISIQLFVVLYLFRMAADISLTPQLSKSFNIAYKVAMGSYINFTMMCGLVSVFVLCWFHVGDGYRFQRLLIPYGRMSLTNYITQSIIGCTVYAGYGLGLWEKVGATLSILIGLCIFALQLYWSRVWLSHFKQGPLEYLWKRLTWICHK